jgi:hypothetical protein
MQQREKNNGTKSNNNTQRRGCAKPTRDKHYKTKEKSL